MLCETIGIFKAKTQMTYMYMYLEERSFRGLYPDNRYDSLGLV